MLAATHDMLDQSFTSARMLQHIDRSVSSERVSVLWSRKHPWTRPS
jgi:hypothetical protein